MQNLLYSNTHEFSMHITLPCYLFQIKILLDSNISKVPEALSLLWVGLPHPRLHPATSVDTWTELCLPLLQRSNVPRQVFSYAVTYTCTLIK